MRRNCIDKPRQGEEWIRTEWQRHRRDKNGRGKGSQRIEMAKIGSV